MPSGAHHYEEAVLKGTALVLLDLPRHLLGAVAPLRKLLDECYPHNGITHMLLNDAPVRSNSDAEVMECGAVFFKSAVATWALLDRVEVVLRTEDGPLELRRGYLKLGDQRILVEGVVTWGAEGRERPSQPVAAPAVAQPVAQPRPPQQQQQPQQSPTATPAPSQLPAPATSRVSAEAPVAAAAPAKTASETHHSVEESTVVVSLHFKEVYNRHRNVRDEQRRIARGDLPTMFPLTPFMVHQMLVAECQPRKIVLIDSRRVSRQRVMKALVELESAEAAERVVHVFTHRAVEYVSESAGARKPERLRGRGSNARVDPKPICAEVRYYINAYYSTQNGQSRFHPNGERNYHRTITVRHQEKDAMNLVDPRNSIRLSVRAPREWQRDTHSNRIAGVPDAEFSDHDEPDAADAKNPRGATAGSASSSQLAPQYAPARYPAPADHREERGGSRRRSPADRSGHDSRRRSRSRSPSASSASSSRSASSRGSRSSSSDSSASSRARHYRRHPRREHSRDRHAGDRHSRTHSLSHSHQRGSGSGSGAERGSRFAKNADRYDDSVAVSQSSSAAVGRVFTPAVAAGAPVERKDERLMEQQQLQQQHQQERELTRAVAPQSTSAAPPPPPPRELNDGLPPGWRPIFSEEYKQTYYAYRDPQTGTETTTWERPQS